MRILALLISLLLCSQARTQVWYNVEEYAEVLDDGGIYLQNIVSLDNELYILGAGLTGLDPNVIFRKLYGTDPQTEVYVSSGVGRAAALYHDTLFVGGQFNNAMGNGQLDKLMYMADNGNVGTLPATFSDIRDLIIYNDQLILGGYTYLNGDADFTTTVAAYANGEISVFGAPVGGGIDNFEIFQGNLFVGGVFAGYHTVNFDDSSYVPCADIAYFDGEEWHCPGGVNNQISSMLADNENGMLYIGGLFSLVDWGDVEAKRIAAYDGENWYPVGEGFSSGNVLCMAIYHGQLYAGGIELMDGGYDLVYFNGVEWGPVVGEDQITSGTVTSMIVHEGDLLVGGVFNYVGDLEVNGMARYHLEPDEVVSKVPEAAPSKSLFTVFPNPSAHMTRVELDSQLLGQQLEIKNTLGQTIEKKTLNQLQFEVDMSAWSPGTYFFVIGNNQVKVVKSTQ